MIKVYLMVGMLCIPSIECFNFMEPNPKQYTNLQECLADGKKAGDDMYDRMNNKNIPSTVRVYCKEIEQHGEYS